MIVIGSPIINEICFVLWRMIFIVVYIITEPPRRATVQSEASGTLLLPHLAAFLSDTVIIIAIRDIIPRYA